MKVKSGGTAVGVAYWFTLHMYGGITVSTYQPEAMVSQSNPCSYGNQNSVQYACTLAWLQVSSHWHQSVFLLPEDVNLSVGETVTLRTLLRDSYLDITMATE